MLFASLDFLLFLAPVLAAYWLLADRPGARALLLIGASYFFYAASARPAGAHLPAPWYYAGLLFLSTLLDYGCAHGIHRHARVLHDSSASLEAIRRAQRLRSLLLTTSLVGNLGLLGYFKYTNFLIEAFADVARVLGAGFVAPHLEILLPIGISFYTFQTLSYTIDVYRQRLTPEPEFRRFALFVVFFPQLVAGPIVRASELLPQLEKRPSLTLDDVDEAFYRIIKGLLKKVVLGDFIAASFADRVFDTPEAFTSLENLLSLYAFTLQIYADFSGYSDIAIGVARLMGLRLPENFDRPYQASNIGEFWRRWHMTLSTWLRDYLFFPLGGSKLGPARTYFNLWLTMFLVGMWHGAGWNFVIYANLHGMAMVFNRWNRDRDRSGGWWSRAGLLLVLGAAVAGLSALFAERVLGLEPGSVRLFSLICGGLWIVTAAMPEPQAWWSRALAIFLTFHFSVLTRVFFRAEDFERAKVTCRRIIEWDGRLVRPGLFRVQFAQRWLLGDGALLSAPVWNGLYLLVEYGVAILLVLGILYHFTPRRWVDTDLRALIRRLPAPLVGVLLAAIGILLLVLLDGPRANIYFSF